MFEKAVLRGFILLLIIIPLERYNNNLTMGKKIENYSLESVIGEGEFGKVYRAMNDKTQAIVAVKVIKVDKFKMSPKLEEFTINEIQTLSQIEDTTHVVKFLEILKTANNYYFVYEFCNGGTLEQELKTQTRFQEPKALSYFQELLRAFRMLTKKNIMHRDVKPSNILLHNGVLKLADFGFCKPLKDSRDLAQTMLGSPIYMAPEILKGEVYTMKADIWSLGVVLYEMLYGFCPFEERTIARLISLIEDNTVSFPEGMGISKKTQDLMKKMLVKDQFKRISWEELFDYDLSKEEEETSQKIDKNPFMKKQQYQSTNNQQTLISGPALTNITNFSTQKDPLQFKKPPTSLPPSTNNPQPNNGITFPTTNIPNNTTNVYTQKNSNKMHKSNERVIKPLLQMRTKVKMGLKMVQELLCSSNSKLTINICCFLMKKVQDKSKDLAKNMEQLRVEKENQDDMQFRRVFTVLSEEVGKLQEGIAVFEEQLRTVPEPLDIVFMRYAEEEGLTQKEEGLLQLLKIDDYLHGIEGEYGWMRKRQLVRELEKRVTRHN